MQRRWIYVGAGVVAVLLLFFLYKKYRIAPDINFPDMQLTDLAGNTVSLERYGGKPLVLSFAASWCGPCMQELSELKKVKGEVDAVADILIVSDETPEQIENMIFRGGFTFEFLRSEKKFSEMGILSIPTSYLLDKDGKVVKKEVGYIDWSDPGNRAHLLTLMQR